MKCGLISVFGVMASLGLAVTAPAASISLYVSNSSTVQAYTLSNLDLTASLSGTTFTAPTGGWSDPFAMTVDSSGHIYVSDAGNNRVVEYMANGNIRGIFTTPTDTTGGGSNGINPQEIALDASGNLYTTSYNGTITEFTSAGGFAQTGTTLGTIPSARGILVVNTGALSGKTLVASSGLGGSVYDFTTGSTFTGTGTTYLTTGAYPDGQLRGITFDSAGNIYTVDSSWNVNGGYVIKNTTTGTPLISGLGGPNSILFDSTSGDLLIADYYAGTIDAYTTAGVFVEHLITGLTNPTGIALSTGVLNGGAEPLFFTQIADAPEPATFPLLGGALLLAGYALKASRRKAIASN